MSIFSLIYFRNRLAIFDIEKQKKKGSEEMSYMRELKNVKGSQIKRLHQKYA